MQSRDQTSRPAVRGVDYIRQAQHHGYCCQIVALLNAALHLGATRLPQGEDWLRLLSVARCRYCPPDWERVQAAADWLGLILRDVPAELSEIRDSLPVMIMIPTRYVHPHAALIVGVEGEQVRLVNYSGLEGTEVVETRPFEVLRITRATSIIMTEKATKEFAVQQI